MAKLVKRAGGIMIKDRKVLVCKASDHSFFLPPGGGVDGQESMEQALIRELMEELSITTSEADFELFNSHVKKSDALEPFDLQMDAFLVKNWSGEIIPDNEIEEISWIDSKSAKEIKLGSIFESQIIPKLVKLDLID